MLLVTGATGTVGNQVARILANSGAYVRVLARNPERASFPSGVEAVRGDFTDPQTLARAADGADGLFVMLPSMDADVEAAVRAAAPLVKRVAVLSSALVSIDTSGSSFVARRHLALENAVKASASSWTIVRPGYFASNALRWWLPQLQSSDMLRWPYPKAQFAPIHERDIAEIAVMGMTGNACDGEAYTLTGPAAITAEEQLAIIGKSSGRNLRYEQVDASVAREALAFLPPPLLDGILASWERATNDPPFVTGEAARVLGKPARTFDEWASDHAAAFAKSAA